MKAALFAMALHLIGAPDSYVTPASKKLQIKAGQQIVAIGDSITQAGGYLKAVDAAFAQQYPDLKLPAIVNVGISGQKAEDLVKRFEKDVVEKKPAIVTISIGINDVWHRVEKPHDPEVLKAYKANVARMVEMAQKAKIKVILLAPTVIQEDPTSEGNQRLKMYIEAGRQVAKEHKCTYVDLHAVFLDAIKNGKSIEADAKGNRFTTDGVHMRPLGDTLMAIGVLRGLGVPDKKIEATNFEPGKEKK